MNSSLRSKDKNLDIFKSGLLINQQAALITQPLANLFYNLSIIVPVPTHEPQHMVHKAVLLSKRSRRLIAVAIIRVPVEPTG